MNEQSQTQFILKLNSEDVKKPSSILRINKSQMEDPLLQTNKVYRGESEHINQSDVNTEHQESISNLNSSTN